MELAQRYKYVVSKDMLLNIIIFLAAIILIVSLFSARSSGLADTPAVSNLKQPLYQTTSIDIPAKYAALKPLPVDKDIDQTVSKPAAETSSEPAVTPRQTSSTEGEVSEKSSTTSSQSRNSSGRQTERQINNLLNSLFKNLY